MKNLKDHKSNSLFERFAATITRFAGRSVAFIIAFLIILVWGALGPMFNFSETWQIFINTLTTIITFMMVFIIQHTQNKDSLSIHLKFNEIVAAMEGASNRLINAEDMSEEELKVLQKYYARLIAMSKDEEDLGKSHSIEEAEDKHKSKLQGKSERNKEVKK